MSVLRSNRLPPALLATLATLGALLVVRSLIVPDLNWCYRYLGADSFDWINNGIFWAGAQVSPSLRPPGLPLLIAALWKLGALSYLPVVGFLFLGLSTAALYALLRERYDAWIAAVACWFFFANGYVQDLARYVMAETYAAPFLVLAALAFVRSERAPRAWIAFGLSLGAGFLFAYVAAPAGIGFGVALLVVARKDLRRKELWMGLLACGLVAGCWIAFRWSFYRSHAGGPRHGVEALLRPSISNIPFYAFAALALLGLVPLVLYVAGALRFTRLAAPPPRWRAAIIGPLGAVSLFWLFVYDWADKRFLLYVLPFLVCFLAEGLVLLRDFARKGMGEATAAAGFFVLALLWNQVRYPSYGFHFLALTPVHFFETGLTFTPAQKALLHMPGRVVRANDSVLDAFSRGLFDPRRTDAACAVTAEEYSCLAVLRHEVDRQLPSGQPVGLPMAPLRGWPSDYWSSQQRLANELLRPVALPSDAEILFVGIEAVPAGADVSRPPFLARCGPYVLVRRQ